ncbi:MAG: hypothetical protein ABWW69_04605 [Pyrodictiaceae archaeon]
MGRVWVRARIGDPDRTRVVEAKLRRIAITSSTSPTRVLFLRLSVLYNPEPRYPVIVGVSRGIGALILDTCQYLCSGVLFSAIYGSISST